MIKIKEGPELDLAVAEAIGVKCYLSKERDTPLCVVTGPGSEVLNKLNASGVSWRNTFPFQPSIDLNAAFAATEKFGLFSGNHLHIPGPGNFCAMLYKLSDGIWHVSGNSGERYSDAETPALAICAAILKAKA